VDLTGFAGVESFFGVGEGPDVHVGYLRAVGAFDAPEVSGGDFPGSSVFRGDFEGLLEGCFTVLYCCAEEGVEFFTAFFGWEGVDVVA